MKRIAYIILGFIVALWLYSVMVTEPPYGLDELPPTTWWITVKHLY